MLLTAIQKGTNGFEAVSFLNIDKESVKGDRRQFF